METLGPFQPDTPKATIIAKVKEDLTSHGYTIAEVDDARPWGGFVRLANTDAPRFIQDRFQGVDLPIGDAEAPLSPKMLIVEPHKQLSWQYHGRRAEHWAAIEGPVGVKLNDTDMLPDEVRILQPGEILTIPQGQRHRLIGLDAPGLVAEIWEHTNLQNPSNEEDIIRVSDDFGR